MQPLVMPVSLAMLQATAQTVSKCKACPAASAVAALHHVTPVDELSKLGAHGEVVAKGLHPAALVLHCAGLAEVTWGVNMHTDSRTGSHPGQPHRALCQ